MTENWSLQQPAEREVSVVYGVYSSLSQPWHVRLKDFWVDRSRVSVQEKSYFFHLLAVMLDAGIPIMKALKVLSKKTLNERFARVINTLAYDVERGKQVSQSMTKFPDIFKESEIGVIRSGEAIGNLSLLLFRLAEQTERTHALFMKVRGAMIYPATVLVALALSAIVVVVEVIPKMEMFLGDSTANMPFLTNVVLSGGRFLVNFGGFLALLGVVLLIGISLYVSSPLGRRKWDGFVLTLPWIKEIIRKLNVAKFVQILSLLMEAGVPIHEAIRISSGAMNNVLYQDFLAYLKQQVEQGEKIADNLAKAPFLFPEMVVSMVSVGESSGHLGQISDKLARHYETEVENALAGFTTVLEPLVIVLVGLAVGVFALALLGPIFSLSSIVGT